MEGGMSILRVLYEFEINEQIWNVKRLPVRISFIIKFCK